MQAVSIPHFAVVASIIQQAVSNKLDNSSIRGMNNGIDSVIKSQACFPFFVNLCKCFEFLGIYRLHYVDIVSNVSLILSH